MNDLNIVITKLLSNEYHKKVLRSIVNKIVKYLYL